ncbi:MAG: GWxTD domain-containing protein [Gemmatimonadaceae bacterium]|nr:GWxTD domain-containing protein [Gemmatimonadaceae bacterium]
MPAPAGPGLQRDTRNISFDPAPLYRQMGMIARGLPFPIVARVGYLATSQPDSTHVLLALSFSATSLSFSREADNRYRANYSVSIGFSRDGRRVKTVETTESVLVGSYRETGRTDENLLFQEIVDLPPGPYTLNLAIRDLASQRGIEEIVEMTVPSYAAGGLSTPIPIIQVLPRVVRDSLPFILLQPRATAVFGRDSVLPLYVESYNEGDDALLLLARNENGRLMWSDAVSIQPMNGFSAGIIEVPVSRLGIGVSQLSLVREAGRDTTSAYVFVGFGDELPVARFDDMLQFLRYFATQSRLDAMRQAPEEDRPAAWARFLAETDSQPNTTVHEDLRDYFSRLVRANGRFTEEGLTGWMTDRGKVFVVLGEPDQILEPTFTDYSRNRQQLWEYRNLGLQLVFYDQTGSGLWRLTQSSEVRFENEFRRRLR